MAESRYVKAVTRALRDAMAADPSVILIGEDVAAAGGSFKATRGLLEEFGPARVYDAPIAEAAITGIAVGAALSGMRRNPHRPTGRLVGADRPGGQGALP